MVWWKRGVQMVMHSIIRVLGRHIELPLTCTKWLDIFAANSYGVTQLMHDASSLLYRLSTYVCIFMGQAHDILYTIMQRTESPTKPPQYKNKCWSCLFGHFPPASLYHKLNTYSQPQPEHIRSTTLDLHQDQNVFRERHVPYFPSSPRGAQAGLHAGRDHSEHFRTPLRRCAPSPDNVRGARGSRFQPPLPCRLAPR